MKRVREATEPHRVLHGYWRSSASWRVRIALEYKKLAYDYKAVNLLKKEESSAEYAALNPNGVPTYTEDGDVVIPQSLAILEYLEERYPETPPLLPKSAADRAKVRAISLIVVSLIHPLQNNVVLGKIEALGGADVKLAWTKEVISDGLASFEQQIQKTAGKYCFGDALSFADVCLAPQVYNAKRFAVDLTPFPTIRKVMEALDKEEAFVVSHPDKMPDATL